MSMLPRRFLSHLPGPLWATVLAFTAIAVVVTIVYRWLHPEWVFLQEAETWLKRGALQEAQQGLQQALRHASDNPVWNLKVGLLALRLEDWPRAEQSLQAALRKKPDQAGAAAALAEVYQRQEQPVAALHVLIQAQEAGAKFAAPNQLQMAGLYRQLHLYPEAEALYRQLVRQRDQAEVATVELAEMLAWQQKYAEAIELLRSLLERHPDNRPARLALARVLSWAGQTEESLHHYQLLLAP